MDFLKRVLNVQGGVALGMVLALYLEWYDRMYKSQWNARQTAFYTSQDIGIIKLVIFLTFISFIVALLMECGKMKDRIIGGCSLVILIINFAVKFFFLPDGFDNTLFGFYVMAILCVIQVVIMYLSNTKEINEMVANKISKI